MILKNFTKKLINITMNKIRLQQSQNWIKLWKILVASLLFWQARMTQSLILNCLILKVSFLHFSKDLQSFMFSRLKWILTGDFKSKSRSKWILLKEWFKLMRTKACKTPIMLPSFRLIKLARSTLIFLKQGPNWIRKKIQ